MLTHDHLLKICHYDPETGIFTRLRDSGRRWKPGQVMGWKHKRNGYYYVGLDGVGYFAHRLAWFYVTGEWPTQDIDHIDRNPQNNRFANLRQVTEIVNAQNQGRAHAGAKSGLLGVYPNGHGRWKAMICVNKKAIYLGTFDDPDTAHAAYIGAKRLSHIGCTI